MVGLNFITGFLHSSEHTKAVWWFNIVDSRFESYSLAKVKKHADRTFTPVKENNEAGWIKGRVLQIDGLYYLVIYTEGYHRQSESIVDRVLKNVNSEFLISYIVDESGGSYGGR